MRLNPGIIVFAALLLIVNGVAWAACWNNAQAGLCTHAFCECRGRSAANCNGNSWIYRGTNGSAQHCYAGGEVVGPGQPGFTQVLTQSGGCGNKVWQKVFCASVIPTQGGQAACDCNETPDDEFTLGQLDSTTCESCEGTARGVPPPRDLMSPVLATADGVQIKLFR